MNRLIIDFINHVVIDFDGAARIAYRLGSVDKETVIRSTRIVPKEYLPEVLEANIIGIDFAYDEIVLYEGISLNYEEEPYPFDLLEEYNSFQIENAKDAREILVSTREIDVDLADTMADGVINRVADDILKIMYGG